MARLHFTDRYPSSDRRKLSVNRFLRENIKAGLEGPDKAKYQLQGWAKSEYQSGPDRSIKLKPTEIRMDNVALTAADSPDAVRSQASSERK